MTWRKWGDILVDLPLHLYTPWRLSLGEVLYRDVINLHGPFSETYHGLLFRLFGASVGTLIGASLALLVAQVSLLYALFSKAAGSLVASLICGVFLVAFAFAHLTGIGNYNYILPYNYELIHGLFFSTCSLLFLSRWSDSGRMRDAGLAGLFFGLAALTKQEIFLGLGLAVGAGFILDARKHASNELWKSFGWFLGEAMVPVFLFWGFFASSLGCAGALRVLAWPWTALLLTGASGNAFHRAGLGLDDPLEHLAATIQAAGLGVLLILLAIALCHRRVPKALQISAGFLLMGLAWRCDWRESGLGLPLFSLIAIPLLLLEGRGKLSFPVVWAVFGLGLLAKMGINCRIYHYGYVLAMPAALGLIFFLLKTLPDLVERYGIDGRFLRAMLAGIICVGTIRLGRDSWEIYSAKTYVFGSGGDRMLTFPPQANARAEPLQLSVDWLKKNTPAQATLAAFPQGVILNYLARRPNPTPYLTWIMTEYNSFGEHLMLGALQEHAPDFIALVHTDTSEYGPRFFGQPGYAVETMRWIQSNYRPVFLAGSEPFRSNRFGIKLLKRQSSLRESPTNFVWSSGKGQ